MAATVRSILRMHITDISIRLAGRGDARALRRVAERDSRQLPGGRLLVAEVAGEVQAALSLDTAESVADPFQPTAALVDLLRSARARGRATGRGRVIASVNSPFGLPRPDKRPARPVTPGAELPCARGRKSTHRATDPLRHLRRRGHPQGCRFRQGLAGVARHSRSRSWRSGACPLLAASVGSEQGPTIVLHGHLDVVPGARGAVRAADRGRPHLRARRLRHEGRAGRDDGRARGAARRARGAGVLAIVPDEESEEEVDRGTQFLIQNGYTGDFAITGEPTDLHVGVQAKGVLAMRPRGQRHGRARRDAVARRQRDPEGARRVPRDRDAAVRARELRPVRPPVDQPGPHPRRRRAQQGAGQLRDRRRHPLPARPGPGRHPEPGLGAAGRRRW